MFQTISPTIFNAMKAISTVGTKAVLCVTNILFSSLPSFTSRRSSFISSSVTPLAFLAETISFPAGFSSLRISCTLLVLMLFIILFIEIPLNLEGFPFFRRMVSAGIVPSSSCVILISFLSASLEARNSLKTANKTIMAMYSRNKLT